MYSCSLSRFMSSTSNTYASRKRIRPCDAFFAPGDRIALHDANTQVFFYTEEGEAVDEHVSTHDAESTRDSNHYPCSHAGCTEVYATLEECDVHYLNTHMLECGQCHAILPNAHLLDLHLQEEHDSFFASAVSRGQASYHCLESGCPFEFCDEETRQSHLRETHCYPKWFRFHPRGISNEKLSRGSCRTKRKKKFKAKHGSHQIRKASLVEQQSHGDNGPRNTNVGFGTYDERRQLQLEKKKARKERQKKARAQVPCKFHSMEGGCWRGDRCDFKHASTCDKSTARSTSTCTCTAKQLSFATTGESEDMDVDRLIKKLEQTKQQSP
mmetsp:Transcript_38234/g.83117  ORF Transcript_38234/g.83117 Transcript_38234/m.83117 type:complete len:326 (+) Transcript_38234:463-1440(+)